MKANQTVKTEIVVSKIRRGEVTFVMNGQTYVLREGDTFAITFDATLETS